MVLHRFWKLLREKANASCIRPRPCKGADGSLSMQQSEFTLANISGATSGREGELHRQGGNLYVSRYIVNALFSVY